MKASFNSWQLVIHYDEQQQMHSFACRCLSAPTPPTPFWDLWPWGSTLMRQNPSTFRSLWAQCGGWGGGRGWCWRALERSSENKNKRRSSTMRAHKKSQRETGKSIWIDKCHQNRSGIKFIMPSGGLARWVGGGWQGEAEKPGKPWRYEELCQGMKSIHQAARAASSINSSGRQFRRKEGRRTFKYWIICFSFLRNPSSPLPRPILTWLVLVSINLA